MVSVTDWFAQSMSTFGQMNPYGTSGLRKGSGGVDLYYHYEDRQYSVDGVELTTVKYQSGLINGRGRSEGMGTLPLETFNVNSDMTYRFRVASMAAEFSFELSIEDHVLTLVALDGQEIQPVGDVSG